MVKPAKRVESIELSQIRKMFEATNPDAINLGIGEPDFPVPRNIKESMKQAINKDYTHYTPNKGFEDLRLKICEKFQKDNKITTTPDNVIVTSGASEALYDCAQALFEKGDNVLIQDPGFLSYDAIIRLAEANPIPVSTPLEDDFKLKADSVNELISPNTKAIIINSPCNPTGAVIDKKDIKGICELAEDHDFMIISDEIYEKIIYGDNKHYSPGAYTNNVITLNGFSKTYAMTGLRIGYMSAPSDITEELLKVHQYNIACASSIAQKGAYEALTGPQNSVKSMVKEFERRKNLIVKRLNDMGYKTPDCEGAFYAFPRINKPEEFVKTAMDKGVICVLGKAFGPTGQKHVRMSYANSYENIEKAMDILETI